MNISTQPAAGDHIAVDAPAFIGRMIKRTLTTRHRKCRHWHDAIVLDSPRGLLVYNEGWPYSRHDPLDSYLKGIEKRGGRWAVTRPAWVNDADLALREQWRRHINTGAKFLVGNRYPLKDLWCIYKKQNRVLRRIRILKPSEKAHFYCTSAVRHLWKFNSVKPWEPRALVGERLPAPIHMEHAMRDGDLILVTQSQPGFFESMSQP